MNAHNITAEFERAIAEYTGAKYCVALDNGSNALFLALKYNNIEGKNISIPSHTYPSVPCEIIHAGGKVKFIPSEKLLRGYYDLEPTNVIDSALWFSADMYVPGSFMCLSFTGPYKTLKLGKAGAILTDNEDAYKWFKRKRFSGRNECSYHEDALDETGWNFYLHPTVSALGIQLMLGCYNQDGSKKTFEPLELPYPDLSTKSAYK